MKSPSNARPACIVRYCFCIIQFALIVAKTLRCRNSMVSFQFFSPLIGSGVDLLWQAPPSPQPRPREGGGAKTQYRLAAGCGISPLPTCGGGVGGEGSCI